MKNEMSTLTKTYNDVLDRSAQARSSLVCLGLDPKPEVYPYQKLPPAERVVKVFGILFDRMLQTGVFPSAVKPNIGYYHRLDHPMRGDFSGSMALVRVLQMIRDAFPGMPVILDSKRGDIATSSANYAEEAFDGWEADAVTVAPYMGEDSISPFTRWSARGKGIYILNRTSNPGGADVQNLEVKTGEYSRPAADSYFSDGEDTMPLYLRVAQTIARESDRCPGTGAVVGATNLRELEDLAAYYGDKEVPLLIPGVGGQGGSAAETMDALERGGYPLRLARINSSSGLTHPWAKRKQDPPANWDSVCLDALERLNEEVGYDF